MKRITIILFSLVLTLPIAAQKKTLELGIYGGLQTYTKIGNPYENSFSSGFGIGFLSKYYISNRLFWTTDLFGATDDGTELKLTNIPEGNRILSMSRKDYSISTGFGFNVISTKQFNYYLQLCGGIGIIDGSYEHFTPNNGTERIDIKHTSYIISPSTGIDFIVANHWKIGAGYTFRYLGDFDRSHSLFARITYVFGNYSAIVIGHTPPPILQ